MKLISTWLNKIIFAGIVFEDDFSVSKKIVLSNQMMLVVMLFTGPYALFFVFVGAPSLGLFILVAEVAYGFCLYLNSQKKHLIAKILFMITSTTLVGGLSAILGPNAGVHPSLIILFAIAFTIFERKNILWRWLTASLPILVLCYLELSEFSFFYTVQLSDEINSLLSFLIILCEAAVIGLILQFLLEINQFLYKASSQNDQFPILTKRENEVVTVLTQGKNNKDIARYLFIEECTVKNHLQSIYEKLQVKTRLELMKKITGNPHFLIK